MDQINVRTTFDNDGYADSHEIKYSTYKLLATNPRYKTRSLFKTIVVKKQSSEIEVWDKNKNCILRTILYKPIHEVKHTTLKVLLISAIDSNQQ